MQPEAREPDAIWVVSDVAPDGTYVTTVQASDDVAVVLDRKRAMEYAMAVYTAVGYAEYDAAVFHQLVSLGISHPNAAHCVGDLRADRAPLDDAATAPLRFVPLVTAAKHQPAVYVEVNGRRISQWTTSDARQHAGHVLDICAAVDLDAAYRRYLRGPLRLDDGRARAVVGSLGEHRIGGSDDAA
jgi:hypothetical protein